MEQFHPANWNQLKLATLEANHKIQKKDSSDFLRELVVCGVIPIGGLYLPHDRQCTHFSSIWISRYLGLSYCSYKDPEMLALSRGLSVMFIVLIASSVKVNYI